MRENPNRSPYALSDHEDNHRGKGSSARFGGAERATKRDCRGPYAGASDPRLAVMRRMRVCVYHSSGSARGRKKKSKSKKWIMAHRGETPSWMREHRWKVIQECGTQKFEREVTARGEERLGRRTEELKCPERGDKRKGRRGNQSATQSIN